MPIKENPKKTFFIFLFFKFWNCPWILSRLISKSVKNHHHHLLQLLIFTLFLSEKGLNSSKKYAFLNFISPNSKKPTNQKKKTPDSILDTKTLLLHPTNSSKPIFSQVNIHINIDTWVYENRSGNSNILHLSQSSKTRNTQISKSNKNHKSIINQT